MLKLVKKLTCPHRQSTRQNAIKVKKKKQKTKTIKTPKSPQVE